MWSIYVHWFSELSPQFVAQYFASWAHDLLEVNYRSKYDDHPHGNEGNANYLVAQIFDLLDCLIILCSFLQNHSGHIYAKETRVHVQTHECREICMKWSVITSYEFKYTSCGHFSDDPKICKLIYKGFVSQSACLLIISSCRLFGLIHEKCMGTNVFGTFVKISRRIHWSWWGIGRPKDGVFVDL